MTLGHCILHANHIDTALSGVFEPAVATDDMLDIGVGVASMTAPEAFVTDYLGGVQREVQALLQRVEQAIADGTGVLGDLQRLVREFTQVRFDELRLTPWVDRLADLIGALEPAGLTDRLDGALERLAVAFPELNGGGLLDRAMAIALGGLDVLERRRLDGHDDIAGHRTFRTARIVRYWLGDAVSTLRAELAGLDLIATVRRALRELTAGLTSPGGEFLRDLGDRLRAKVRPFAVAIDALLAVRVSVRVEAEVDALPEQGHLWLDDNTAAPFDTSHPLWWLDLGTSLGALGFSIVDVQRFNPFAAPRAGDALLSVLNLWWQTVRMLVRALRPDFLKKNHSTTPGAFWFSELGDFCVQVFLNLLGSLHEASHAGSNWVMSFACRLARWFTFTLQPRLPYIFARSVWYARAWHEQGWVRAHTVAAGETIDSIAAAAAVDPARLRVWNRIANGDQPKAGDTLYIPVEPTATDRVRARRSYVRDIWSAWFWLWLTCAINGISQGWDDLQLSSLGETRFVKVGLWLGPLVGLLAAIFLPMAVSEGTTGVEYEIDWASFSALVAMMMLMIAVAAVSMYSTNATRDKWWIAVLLGVLIAGLLFVPVLVCWLKDEPDLKTAGWFLYIWGLVVGAIVFGILTTLLWWIYIDDGRDKEGKFTGLRADSSPYKLPYPKGELWVCGQGFHGIFSHYLRDNDFNHYGYDFLEGQDRPAVAARGGLVTSVRQASPYGHPDQNDLIVAHLDWAEGHDPGEELERVQTFSHYIHIGPRCARIDIDQYVVQGQNVVDIDSTGISAQHHLHFGASTIGQDRWPQSPPPGRTTRIRYIWSRDPGLPPEDYFRVSSRPVIFADPSLRRDRTNPILRFIPGHIHHPGRPLAQCLYESDNERKPGTARPIVLTTVAAEPDRAGSHHTHRLEIDVAKLPLDGRLTGDPIELWTTVDAGHRHRVTLDAARVEALLHHDLPADWKSESALTDALAHDHAFSPEPFAGAVAPPPVAGVTQPPRVDSPIAQVGLTAPPPAQLLARTPGPYDLLGQRLIVRLDDRATEFLHFGGDRATLVGDLAIDRAPRPTDVLSVSAAGMAVAPATASPHAGARAGVGELDVQLAARAAAARTIPVLVLETRDRGNLAALTVDTTAGAGRSFGDPALGPIVAQGSGALARRAITRADLRALILAACNGAPAPTPPAAGQVQIAANPHGGTDLAIAAAAVTAAGGPLRARKLYAGRYDAAAKQLTGDGPLPLGAGRLRLEWGVAGSALDVPLAGTPAALALDPAAAGLAAGLEQSLLFITVGATEVALRLPAGLALADLAALLMREVDGLRAWTQDGKLRLETVDVGPGVRLAVRKRVGAADFTADATGEAPKLAGGDPIDDSALVTRDELIRAVGDAAQRSAAAVTRAAAIAAHTQPEVKVDWQGDRLRIFVDAPATIELVAADSSQALLRAIGHEAIPAADPPALQRSADQRELLSRPLTGDPLELPLGWLDLRLGAADVRRVHLDAEPARIDLAPPKTWPEGQLDLTIGADAVHVDLAGKTSLVAVAEAIRAAAGDRLLVRVGHRVAVEARHPGRVDLELGDSPGRAALGFTARGVLLASGLGPALDLHAVAADGDVTTARRSVGGALGDGYTATTIGQPDGEHVELVAAGDRLLRLSTVAGTADPFGLTSAAAPSKSVLSGPVATAPLGRRTIQYQVDLLEDGAGPTAPAVARTFVQFGASPAVLRATRPLGVLALALAPAARLQVRVTWPTAGGPQQRDCTLDLAWASDLLRERGALVEDELRRRVVDQLQRELPLVDAWLVGGATPARLHLQTRGAGTGWRLCLTGAAAIVALGFDPARLTGDTLEVAGGGDVVDESHPTAAELRDVFTAAAARVTLMSGEAAFDVLAAGSRLTLVSPGAAVTLRVEPPALAAALPTSVAGDATVIDTTRPLDLPGGRIVVERAGAATAALFVHGTRASVRSHGPATGPGIDEAALVAPLKALTTAQRLEITVDGATTAIGRFPAGVTDVAGAVAHLARRVPAARFALVAGAAAGTRDLLVESRKRGSASAVAVRFVGTPATLGFTADLADAGTGTFPDLAEVTAAQLAGALEAARATPLAAAQALVVGSHVAATHHVEIRAADPTADLRDMSHLPQRGGGSLGFTVQPGRRDILDLAWPGPTALASTVLELRYRTQAQTVGGPAVERHVHVPIWGSPGRLALPITAPLPSSFVNRRLALRVDAQDVQVVFTMPSSWDHVALQIEQQSDFRVLARVRLRGAQRILELSTPGEGSAVTLQLRAAAGGPDAQGLLTLPADPLAERRGDGSLPRLDRVEGTDLPPAIAAGLATLDVTPEGLLVDLPPARLTRYVTGERATAPLLRLRSRRRGCMSHVEPLHGHPPFDFDRSLQRGPAVRAAVVIPAGAAIHLDADAVLALEFDDNGAAADVSPPRRLDVAIPAGDHTREALARRIHAVIFGAGAGMAGRYLDDSIVVETATPGLAGSVKIALDRSTAALVTALALGPGAPTEARGWPGAGALEDHEDFRTGTTLAPASVVALASDYMPVRGLRGRKNAPPTADVVWRFRTDDPASGGFQTPDLTLQAGWDLPTLAREVDQKLAQAVSGATTRRIGHARAGLDGALHIEAMEGLMLVLEVKPAGGNFGPLGVDQPTKLGGRVDIKPEPGLDLRATDTLRTYRLVYDREGAAATDHADRFVDAGWLRPPTDGRWGTTRDHDTFEPIDVSAWPHGRYLLAARAEAAKHDYGVDGEMIASAGQVELDGRRIDFARIARYWVGLTCMVNWNQMEMWIGAGKPDPQPPYPPAEAHVPLCAGVRRFAGELLVDWQV